VTKAGQALTTMPPQTHDQLLAAGFGIAGAHYSGLDSVTVIVTYRGFPWEQFRIRSQGLNGNVPRLDHPDLEPLLRDALESMSRRSHRKSCPWNLLTAALLVVVVSGMLAAVLLALAKAWR
jgi:hypothetical protein